MNSVRTLNSTLAGAVFCLLIFGAAPGVNAQMSVGLRIEEPVVSWGESDLTEKLLFELNSHNGLEVDHITGPLSDKSGDYGWESGAVSPDRIGRWGLDHGHRFVVIISHLKTELGVKKGLSIPLALSRYRVVGTISGKVRIIDSERGRIVVDKEFSIDKSGPGAWQLLDDNPNSAKLRISATEKPAFLESLEWRTASELASLLRDKMKLR